MLLLKGGLRPFLQDVFKPPRGALAGLGQHMWLHSRSRMDVPRSAHVAFTVCHHGPCVLPAICCPCCMSPDTHTPAAHLTHPPAGPQKSSSCRLCLSVPAPTRWAAAAQHWQQQPPPTQGQQRRMQSAPWRVSASMRRGPTSASRRTAAVQQRRQGQQGSRRETMKQQQHQRVRRSGSSGLQIPLMLDMALWATAVGMSKRQRRLATPGHQQTGLAAAQFRHLQQLLRTLPPLRSCPHPHPQHSRSMQQLPLSPHYQHQQQAQGLHTCPLVHRCDTCARGARRVGVAVQQL